MSILKLLIFLKGLCCKKGSLIYKYLSIEVPIYITCIFFPCYLSKKKCTKGSFLYHEYSSELAFTELFMNLESSNSYFFWIKAIWKNLVQINRKTAISHPQKPNYNRTYPNFTCLALLRLNL